MKYVAYQGETPVYVADTMDAFAYPQFGLRSEFDDVFAYEKAVALLTDEEEVARLKKPAKALPFILIDRIDTVFDAEIISGAVYVGEDSVKEAHCSVEMAQAKAERATEVERLTVEVNGKVFDADETSQARMSVAASSMSDYESNVWVLHNNDIVYVTKAELLEACRLARIAQSAIWTKPYENASA